LLLKPSSVGGIITVARAPASTEITVLNSRFLDVLVRTTTSSRPNVRLSAADASTPSGRRYAGPRQPVPELSSWSGHDDVVRHRHAPGRPSSRHAAPPTRGPGRSFIAERPGRVLDRDGLGGLNAPPSATRPRLRRSAIGPVRSGSTQALRPPPWPGRRRPPHRGWPHPQWPTPTEIAAPTGHLTTVAARTPSAAPTRRSPRRSWCRLAPAALAVGRELPQQSGESPCTSITRRALSRSASSRATRARSLTLSRSAGSASGRPAGFAKPATP
jgi:hypothetical protein